MGIKHNEEGLTGHSHSLTRQKIQLIARRGSFGRRARALTVYQGQRVFY
jgi:hypothetical protein